LAIASVAVTAPPAVSAVPSAPVSAALPLEPPAHPISSDAIMRDVTWLTAPDLKGRGSGTADEGRAAERLGRELEDAKVPPLDGERTAAFTYKDGGREKKSQNVLGLIEPLAGGKRELIVLGAHYDHLGEVEGQVYYGAEDNASGTAVVLAVARALQTRRAELGRPVIIAFFGAEEDGLHGSRSFVRGWAFDKRPISSMVNVDMIGRSLVDQPRMWMMARVMGILKDVDPERSVGALLPDLEPKGFATLVREACNKHELTLVTIADLPQSVRAQAKRMAKGRGDHAPFEAKKIPFVFFSSGESSDYHLPSDTADKLEPAILEQRARAVLETVIALSK